MFVILLTVLCIVIVKILLDYRDEKRNLWFIPGPLPMPLIGNALMFAKPPEQLLSIVRELRDKYAPKTGIFRAHLGPKASIWVSSVEAFEKILSSTNQTDKSEDYELLDSWLGTGLITSNGKKWHSRRKLLTPAFHFRILEDFIDVINDHCIKFCQILEAHEDNGAEFDIFPLVKYYALDVICETAMGKKLNVQEDKDNEYVKAVYEASHVIGLRWKSPWLHYEKIFNMTPTGARMRKALSTLHGFTDQVIQEKKLDVSKLEHKDSKADHEDFGIKKRKAFLDLLIEASQDGSLIDDKGLREEVDTFMFAGHDTTAINITFTLFLLAKYPDIQQRCFEELQDIFGDDPRPVTSQDLVNMKYLEMCLKESLRLYQSVAMILRKLGEDLVLDDQVIPAGTNCILLIYLLHRDPTIFPNPDKFDPDRFLPENCAKRSPYSYVPFSAGPRNCIGQKFAMMNEKILVSSVLRRFKVKTTLREEDIELVSEVTLCPKDGIFVSLERRR